MTGATSPQRKKLTMRNRNVQGAAPNLKKKIDFAGPKKLKPQIKTVCLSIFTCFVNFFSYIYIN